MLANELLGQSGNQPRTDIYTEKKPRGGEGMAAGDEYFSTSGRAHGVATEQLNRGEVTAPNTYTIPFHSQYFIQLPAQVSIYLGLPPWSINRVLPNTLIRSHSPSVAHVAPQRRLSLCIIAKRSRGIGGNGGNPPSTTRATRTGLYDMDKRSPRKQEPK